jgi:glycosyltransferase involved in cell wall biosynthesis
VTVSPISRDLQVSVIVAARDAGDDLAHVVRALERQTFRPSAFEVVIADDGSQDGSAGALGADGEWLRVLWAPPANPYAARNRGAASARGEVLAFLDADCHPEPDWLERGVAALANADLAAGSVLFTTPRRKSVWALVDTETFLDQERAVLAGSAVTANLLVRRALFEREGGFDGTLANGGDHEFVSRCVRSGARLVYAADAVVWHPTRSSARAFIGKLWTVNRRHGIRESRNGARPRGAGWRGWLPVVQTLRNRIGADRPLTLDPRRLEASGIPTSTWDHVRAIPVIYLLVPYVSAAAQLVGWWQGRRQRTSGSAGASVPAVAPRETE